MPELGNNIRAAREECGWTQAELAARVGVSRKTINTVENGVFVPSTVIALRIARALDRPVEALFFLPG
ncbi:helix-turn-helix transcriptional regulator [Sphingomonas canadensis]|uniref:Helix-turn-helix transcriptional regulator n=1 Tax=Sphingomonas canadensis TaxID=1219257 RepID=A0ABW3H827_9SPHN|nr:helix-turn-helix transcriptional regulator [Sphingomonas canadensis]MCW3837493.1 helix-turn-helix transcriptional regulator [Sphingomonas canadensis]